MMKLARKCFWMVIICPIVSAGFMTGCSSVNSVFSYLKFWEPRNNSRIDKESQDKASAFMPHVKQVRGNPDSHYRLGVHYQARGQYKEAIEEFTKVITIKPDHVFAYNALGIVYDNLDQPEKAREAYREALRIAPWDYHAYNNLGYSYILEGNYDAAVDILLQGMKTNSDNKYIRNNLAMAYVAMDKKDLATSHLKEIGPPDAIKAALEKIEERISQIQFNKSPVYAAGPGILSEDIAQVPATNRFVERMTRVIKNARKAKVKVNNGIPKTVDLRVARLDPNYLKVNAQSNSQQPPAEARDHVRNVMKTRMTEETLILETFKEKPLWF